MYTKKAMTKKLSFYLSPEIEKVIKQAPQKKQSERVEELIRKGIEREKQEQMEKDFLEYGIYLSQNSETEGDLSSTEMSSNLWADEDETTDWY